MKLGYPRSFLSLLVIGFSIVAAPLLFALASNALAFERLAGLAEEAVHSAVKVTQTSRSLLATITSLERSSRQYAVAGEATFLDAYRHHRMTFLTLSSLLDAMSLSDPQRAELTAIERDEAHVDELISKMGPTPELSRRLPQEFAILAQRGQALVRLGDQVIEAGIDELQAKAVQARMKKLEPGDEDSPALAGKPAGYWLDLKDYNPVEKAKRLGIPMLILQGERDFQVGMTDFGLWKAGLGNSPGVALKSYPKLNHLFIAGEGKSTPAEYGKPGHVSVEVVDDIAAFVKK